MGTKRKGGEADEGGRLMTRRGRGGGDSCAGGWGDEG